ncbi:MAG TPA: histidine kinase [Chloroflexota bacterium]|nr:histidine kinase [Chloroflexota bacterium]
MVLGRATRLAWGLWVVTAALSAGAPIAWIAGGMVPVFGEGVHPAADAFVAISYSLTLEIVSAVGALVASRHPRNPIGWMALAFGGVVGLQLTQVGLFSTALYPGGEWLRAALPYSLFFQGCLNFIASGLVGPLLLLFPTGRTLSRRWSVLLVANVVLTIVLALSYAFMPRFPLHQLPEPIPNPFAIPGAEPYLSPIRPIAAGGLLAAIAGSAASLVLRWRRGQGEERQQLKWVAYGAALLTIASLAGALVPRSSPWVNAAADIASGLALGAFAASMAVAILRYRLYEIDTIITRTLAYGALAVLITGGYALVVVGIGAALGSGADLHPVPTLLATVALAVAFQPLRDRLQRLANRLVYGQAANPHRVLLNYSERMAQALSVDEILPRTAEAVGRGLGAARVRVRVFHTTGQEHSVTWPIDSGAPTGIGVESLTTAAAAASESFDRFVPVSHYGEVIGEIAVTKPRGESLTPAEERLLSGLAAQAGPALRNARLTTKLHVSLAEISAQAEALRASRERLAAARDAERRRLERDIHDGAQQHLVALAVTAKLARQLLERSPERAAALLDDVVTQANDALGTVRELARGIFPSLLADKGLVAALRAQVARTCADAEVRAADSLDGLRFDPRIEAGIYFCCLEAVQNASKHAPGARVVLHLSYAAATLRFSVHDDGPGFDPATVAAGTGLQNMADRIAALGGTIEVVSSPAGGTSVAGAVPARPLVSTPHPTEELVVAR